MKKITPAVCDNCGGPVPDGDCKRQACRASKLYWARRAEHEAAESALANYDWMMRNRARNELTGDGS